MVKLEYAKSAFADLKSIRNYIAEDSAYYASLFVKELRNKIESLRISPEIGKPLYPERFKDLRQLLHKSYRIIYHFENSKITVISVSHQSRLVDNINIPNQFKI